MRDRLRALGALSWREVGLLCQAWGLLLLVNLRLRLWPLRRVQDWAATRRAREPWTQDGDRRASVERLHWLVGIAGRHHVVRVHCLQRSLTLQRLLSQCGIGSDLRIGVQKTEGRVHAHAWLEVGGQPVGEAESGAQQFVPLAGP